MMEITYENTQRFFSYVVVACLWGITNPLLKRAASANQTDAIYGTLISLFTDCNKLLPFLLNQLGSLTFYYLLASEPITTAAPLANSLTFGVTAVAAHCLGERNQSPVLLSSGILLVLLGIYISFVHT